MSNRRRPTRPVPLQPIGTRPGGRTGLPPELHDFTLWTDTPPAQYKATTLDWIVQAIPTRMRLNVWVCETCGAGVLCYDLHPGTTPYTVPHHTLGDESCTGTCYSRMYSGVDTAVWRAQLGGPSHEWYRPSVFELGQASKAVREHVQMGGLLVRPVARRSGTVKLVDVATPEAPHPTALGGAPDGRLPASRLDSREASAALGSRRSRHSEGAHRMTEEVTA